MECRETPGWKNRTDEQKVDFLAMLFMHLFSVESGRVRSDQQPVTISNLSSSEVRLRLFQIASLPPRSATACVLPRNGCFDLCSIFIFLLFLSFCSTVFFNPFAGLQWNSMCKIRPLERDFRQRLIKYSLNLLARLCLMIILIVTLF